MSLNIYRTVRSLIFQFEPFCFVFFHLFSRYIPLIIIWFFYKTAVLFRLKCNDINEIHDFIVIYLLTISNGNIDFTFIMKIQNPHMLPKGFKVETTDRSTWVICVVWYTWYFFVVWWLVGQNKCFVTINFVGFVPEISQSWEKYIS